MKSCGHKTIFDVGRFCVVGIVSAVILAAIPGCAVVDWFMGRTSDQEVRDLHADLKAQANVTPFDEALSKLGHLLEAYGVPAQTGVQCKNIGNATAEQALPKDLYTMVKTALYKVGSPIVFIPFDVFYVAAEGETGGKIERILPKVVIGGAITGFDKEMIEKEREGEAEGGWAGATGGANYKSGGDISQITIDLNALDYKTQTGLPGAITANSLVLRKTKLNWGVYGYYMGCGGSFDYMRNTKQGVHAALRLLVEFSVLELLGKTYQVPYWTCFQGATPDDNLRRLVRDDFNMLTADERAAPLKRMLFLHGYEPVNLDGAGWIESENNLLKRAMAEKGAVSEEDLYVKLWETVPVDKAIGKWRVLQKEIQAKRVVRDAAVAAGDRFAAAGNDAEALREYRKAISIVGNDPVASAKAQSIQAKISEARDRRAAIAAAVAACDAAIAAGDRLAAAGKDAAALREYERASALLPSNTGAGVKARDVRVKIERAAAYAAAYAAAGQAFARNEFSKAKEECRKALEFMPGDSDASALLAKINKKYESSTPKGIGMGK